MKSIVKFLATPIPSACLALTLFLKEVALDYLIHGLDFLLLEFHWGDAGVELIQELAEGRKNRSAEDQLDQCFPHPGSYNLCPSCQYGISASRNAIHLVPCLPLQFLAKH